MEGTTWSIWNHLALGLYEFSSTATPQGLPITRIYPDLLFSQHGFPLHIWDKGNQSTVSKLGRKFQPPTVSKLGIPSTNRFSCTIFRTWIFAAPADSSASLAHPQVLPGACRGTQPATPDLTLSPGGRRDKQLLKHCKALESQSLSKRCSLKVSDLKGWYQQKFCETISCHNTLNKHQKHNHQPSLLPAIYPKSPKNLAGALSSGKPLCPMPSSVGVTRPPSVGWRWGKLMGKPGGKSPFWRWEIPTITV